MKTIVRDWLKRAFRELSLSFTHATVRWASERNPDLGKLKVKEVKTRSNSVMSDTNSEQNAFENSELM
mgnify:CR=1 FL=1